MHRDTHGLTCQRSTESGLALPECMCVYVSVCVCVRARVRARALVHRCMGSGQGQRGALIGRACPDKEVGSRSVIPSLCPFGGSAGI